MNVETSQIMASGVIPDGFESLTPAGIAGALAIGGAVLAVHKWRESKRVADSLVYPDPDMETAARRQHRNERWRKTGALAAAGIAMSAYVADMGDPYTESARPQIDSITAIVDASAVAYARDVQDGDREDLRVNVGVNSLTRMSDDLGDIRINFVAAGSPAESMGYATHGATARVADSFDAYFADLSHQAESDMAGALNIAQGTDADKILVIGSLDGVQSDLLVGQAEEGERRISTIALGSSETMIGLPGAEEPALTGEDANKRIVGEEDSYAAESVEEVQEIIDEIINEQYVKHERSDYPWFSRAAFVGAASLVVGTLATAMIRPVKRAYRQITGKKK